MIQENPEMNELQAHGQQARPIGDILIASGMLTPQDAERIAKRQQEDHCQFGDAAVALKLLTREDIDFALSKQFDFSYLPEQDTSRSPELVAAYKPFSRIGENLRAVRSQLMLRWFNGDPARKTIVLASPNTGEGRSFIAANLAIVFAQHGEHTLLIDGDMRRGRQHQLFMLGKSVGLSGILSDRAGLEAAMPVPGLANLAVLPCGTRPPNPQELLGRPAFGNLLTAAATKFDVIIIDSPPGNDYADAEIIASRSGAVAMLARKHQSRVPELGLLSRRLQDSGVVVVGSILNDD